MEVRSVGSHSNNSRSCPAPSSSSSSSSYPLLQQTPPRSQKVKAQTSGKEEKKKKRKATKEEERKRGEKTPRTHARARSRTHTRTHGSPPASALSVCLLLSYLSQISIQNHTASPKAPHLLLFLHCHNLELHLYQFHSIALKHHSLITRLQLISA